MTAIRATFSQYAMVKTRGVLVLHMEVPLEQQAEVFKVLGYPLPGEEVWCGIARLKPIEPGVGPGSREAAADQTHEAAPALGSVVPPNERATTRAPDFAASQRAKAAYAASSDMEKARLRSVLLAKDARFRAWALPVPRGGHNRPTAVEAAEQYIRNACCAGESRRLIAEDRACYEAFIRLETQYLIETNQMAVPR